VRCWRAAQADQGSRHGHRHAGPPHIAHAIAFNPIPSQLHWKREADTGFLGDVGACTVCTSLQPEANGGFVRAVWSGRLLGRPSRGHSGVPRQRAGEAEEALPGVPKGERTYLCALCISLFFGYPQEVVMYFISSLWPSGISMAGIERLNLILWIFHYRCRLLLRPTRTYMPPRPLCIR
jgi:hypothetical protein